MNHLLKCKIKIKTDKAVINYIGLFRSTWYATQDAINRIGYNCNVTVEVMK